MRPNLKYFSINNRDKNLTFRITHFIKLIERRRSMSYIAKKFGIEESSLKQWMKRNWLHTTKEYKKYKQVRFYRG